MTVLKISILVHIYFIFEFGFSSFNSFDSVNRIISDTCSRYKYRLYMHTAGLMISVFARFVGILKKSTDLLSTLSRQLLGKVELRNLKVELKHGYCMVLEFGIRHIKRGCYVIVERFIGMSIRVNLQNRCQSL